jgi:hypothetical protein
MNRSCIYKCTSSEECHHSIKNIQKRRLFRTFTVAKSPKPLFLCLWEHWLSFVFCCLLIFLRPGPRSRRKYSQIRIRGRSESKIWDHFSLCSLADYGWWSSLPWDEWTILASRRDNCQYIDQANTARIYNHHKEPKYESQICFTVCLTYCIGYRYIPGIPRIRIRPLVNPDPDFSLWWPKNEKFRQKFSDILDLKLQYVFSSSSKKFQLFKFQNIKNVFI